MTFGELLNIPNVCPSEAREILSFLTDKNWTDLWMEKNRTVADSDVNRFNQIIHRLEKGEPLAYVLNRASFLNQHYFVDKRVLIPRPETEELARKAIHHTPENIGTILDLGCGSGCLGFGVLHFKSLARLTALDISADAIDVARINARNFGIQNRVEFLLGAAEQFLRANCYDLIVANPPYIDAEDTEIQDSVKNFEPAVALFAKDQGLACLRDWLRVAARSVKSGGQIFFEIGWNQAREAIRLAQQEKRFKDAKVEKDFLGKNRFLVIHAE